MKAIGLNFQIHQPFRLNSFPFYKIGNGDEVFNNELNATFIREESHLYLKLNQLLLQLVDSHPGKFNFNFCISGTALEQFETFAPEVLDSYQELLRSGSLELVGTTFANSLAAIVSRVEFTDQVKSHSQKIKDLFGVYPKAFLISKHLYTEVIGDILSNLGFRNLIFENENSSTENGELNQIFQSPFHHNGVIININQSLSLPFSTLFGSDGEQVNIHSCEQLIERILSLPKSEPSVNLNLSFFGKGPQKTFQLLEFFKQFVNYGRTKSLQFLKFSSPEINKLKQANTFPSGLNHSPDPNNSITNTFLGNYLQQEAFYSLYELEDQVKSLNNATINQIWTRLQSSDHFYT